MCYEILSFCHYAVISTLLAEMELRVGNKYRLGRKIGSGSFGDIYLGSSLFVFFNFFNFGVQANLSPDSKP